jgi:chromate reductase
MRLVTINGSLRRNSSNGALLRAVERVAPPEVELIRYDGLARLPHFNPDLDEEGATPPDEVAALRALLIASDGILVSTPEYAHGLPGAFKNLLDWLVSTGELVEKPVAFFNASPSGGHHAQASLVEILRTMNWRVVDEATLSAPFVVGRITGELDEPETLEKLKLAMDAFVRACRRS